jgi:PAS domain S-box-containing protein
LFCITLLVLVLEAKFIFAPVTRHIRRDTQQLAEKEARLRATLDTAIDGIVSIDSTGRVIDFNPAAEAMFSWKRDEIMGRMMAEVLIPKQHREAHLRGMARFVAIREQRFMNQRVEIAALRRDGSEFPVELAVTSIHQNDEDLFTAYIRDIAQRKRDEGSLALQSRRSEALLKLLSSTDMGRSLI